MHPKYAINYYYLIISTIWESKPLTSKKGVSVNYHLRSKNTLIWLVHSCQTLGHSDTCWTRIRHLLA